VILPKDGIVLLRVLEWVGKSPELRSYAFVPKLGRWLDANHQAILKQDPRHMRLLEIMMAQRVAQGLDQLLGL